MPSVSRGSAVQIGDDHGKGRTEVEPRSQEAESNQDSSKGRIGVQHNSPAASGARKEVAAATQPSRHGPAILTQCCVVQAKGRHVSAGLGREVAPHRLNRDERSRQPARRSMAARQVEAFLPPGQSFAARRQTTKMSHGEYPGTMPACQAWRLPRPLALCRTTQPAIRLPYAAPSSSAGSRRRKRP